MLRIAYFRIHFHPGIGVAKMDRNSGFFSRDQGPERGSPELVVGWPRFPQDRPEFADRSLGINGTLLLDHNRG